LFDNVQSLIESNFNGNRVGHPVNKRFRFLLSVGRLDALDFHLNHLATGVLFNIFQADDETGVAQTNWLIFSKATVALLFDLLKIAN